MRATLGPEASRGGLPRRQPARHCLALCLCAGTSWCNVPVLGTTAAASAAASPPLPSVPALPLVPAAAAEAASVRAPLVPALVPAAQRPTASASPCWLTATCPAKIACTPSPRQNLHCRQPAWTPTWDMSQSTIIMPCNFSGFYDFAEYPALGRFGLADYDWSNAKQYWANQAPMTCQSSLAEQARRHKARPEQNPRPALCGAYS